MFMEHCIHSLVSMEVADGLVPIWCQDISSHYDNKPRMSQRNADDKGKINAASSPFDKYILNTLTKSGPF